MRVLRGATEGAGTGATALSESLRSARGGRLGLDALPGTNRLRAPRRWCRRSRKLAQEVPLRRIQLARKRDALEAAVVRLATAARHEIAGVDLADPGAPRRLVADELDAGKPHGGRDRGH